MARRIVLTFTTVGLYACAAIVDFPDPGLRPSDAGLPDVAPAPPAEDSATPVADPCRETGLPSRPAAETSRPEDALQLTLALRQIDFGTRTSGPSEPRGLNLDGLCSCPEAQACAPFSATPICDTGKGIDNQSARLFKLFTLNSGVRPPDDRYNDAVKQGILGFLVVVAGYNGAQDDAEVAVSIFASGGTPRYLDGGVEPAWDGNDEWEVEPSSLVYVGRPIVSKYATPRAYVTGGVLVAELTYALPIVADLPKGGPAFSIRFERGFLTGKLVRAPSGSWTLEEGLMAGRWATRDLLRVIGLAADPANESQRICDNLSSYGSIKQLMCNYADLKIGQEKGAASGQCDAVSLGIGFTAASARIGPIGPDKPAPTPCPNAGDDCP